MSIVSWNESLKIGHQVIDEQHENLINLINKLYKAIVDDFANDNIKHYMMELYKYTVYHFSQEESLMRKCDYINMEEHLAAHEEFTHKIDDLAKKIYTEKDVSIGKDALKFLLSWLLHHIATTDKQLVECLSKN